MVLVVLGMGFGLTFGLYNTANPWPMFRYDNRHSAASASPAPNNNATLWSRPASDAHYSPIIVEGRAVYIDANVGGGKICAVDETTGTSLWNTSFSSLVYPPTFSNGRFYATVQGGYLYCLSVTTGEILWQYQATATGHIYTVPVVSMGTVYFGTDDNLLCAVNASNGQSLWNYTAGGSVASPSIDGNLLCFACSDGRVYALNVSETLPPPSYQSIWNFTTGGQMKGYPILDADRVYFGSSSTDHSIFAVSRASGELIWKYQLLHYWETNRLPMALANSTLYFTVYSGNKAYALHADAGAGNYTETDTEILKWNITVPTSCSGPTYADGKVLFGCDGDSKLYALDALDGHVIWTYATVTPHYPRYPTAADGRIFVSNYNEIVCIGDIYPASHSYYFVDVAANSYIVDVFANAASGNFSYSSLVSEKKLSFVLDSCWVENHTAFSNITLPSEMLSGPYNITVDGTPVSISTEGNSTHKTLSFSYLHLAHGSHLVEIVGTSVIPEFPSAAILPLLTTATLLAVIICRKKSCSFSQPPK
jgi:outer membrane protein assembly factor BamB